MRSARLGVVFVALVTFAACGGGSSESSDTTLASSTEATSDTTAEETADTTAVITADTIAEATDDTVAPSDEDYVSDISDIGFGNMWDDTYMEWVDKFMTGGHKDAVSDSQIFGLASYTCTALREGKVDEVLGKLKTTRDEYPQDYELAAMAMMGAVNFYCRDVKEPFMSMAEEEGL